jgi:hypothetical protein
MGPTHPFADQFPNRVAWRFEKDLAALAHTTRSAEDLAHRINTWPNVFGDPGRRAEMGTAWRAFVTRKLAALPWPARPDQVQAVITTRARQVMAALPGSARPDRAALDVAAAVTPPAQFYRRDTGEAVQVREAPPYLRRAGPEIEIAGAVGHPAPGGPQVYAAERRRAPGGPVPVGWVSEHVGCWHGRDTEVVYNPGRHQVMVTQVGEDAAGRVEASGWQRHAVDGDRVMWTRDRLVATRAALARHDQVAALAPPGPELRPALSLER